MPQDSTSPGKANGEFPEADPGQHWFAGKDVDVLIYRINRRPPIAGETLMGQPEDLMHHMEEVLRLAQGTVETGRRHKRDWRIGNKAFDFQAGTFRGMVGWARTGSAWSSVWDDEDQAWVDRVVPSDVSAVAPFAFTVDGRYLGVLRHSSFSETTVNTVFRDFLNRGEQARLPFPTTDWDVEPVGDEQGFYEWVDSMDSVLSVDLTFRRPNPDAEREFEELFARLDELRAEQIKEKISARDPERGLDKQALRSEPRTRAFIVAAMAAFGYIVGKGLFHGRQTGYDQRKRIARERIDNVAATWDEATDEVFGAVRQARARRRRDG